MALPVNSIYEPRIMLAALRQRPVPRRFFLQTFFQRVQTHTSKTVEMDVQKTKRRVAGYTGPAAPARVVERDGFYTVETKPAYIKEKIPTRVADLLARPMGTNIYDPITPVQRAAALLGDDLRMLDERVVRREELMCAEALINGKITIRGPGINETVDFGYIPGEHAITLSGTNLWNTDTGDPLKDLDDWRMMINKRCGIIPNRCVVGNSVYWAIMRNKKVLERLDNRRVELGTIKPSDLPEGVRYLGTFMPSMLDVYTYDEWYTDSATGEDKPLVPDDVVLLGSTEARCVMNYGLIQNMNCAAAIPRFPSTWVENDGSARFLQLESAPLPNLFQADAFLVAHVI